MLLTPLQLLLELPSPNTHWQVATGAPVEVFVQTIVSGFVPVVAPMIGVDPGDPPPCELMLVGVQ
jgi:hypothetical protein